MKTKEYIIFFEQTYETEGFSQQIMGEKDFFEFIKRANRDLTARQRYRLMNKAINMIKG
jgi:hypothetical protein